MNCSPTTEAIPFSNVVNGEFFYTIVLGHKIPFMLDDSDEYFYEFPNAAKLKRPRPTSLFDGRYQDLAGDTQVFLCTAEEAQALAKQIRP